MAVLVGAVVLFIARLRAVIDFTSFAMLVPLGLIVFVFALLIGARIA